MASSNPGSPSSSGTVTDREADRERRTFVSKPARVLGWFLIAVALANYIDLAFQGRDHASAVAAAALLLGCGVVYVLCLRPAVIATADALVLVNPLRTLRVPWADVAEVDVTDALRVRAGGRTHRSWALQETTRARVRARRRKPPEGVPDTVAAAIGGRTHCEYVALQLDELAQQRADTSGDGVRLGWSAVAVLSLVVPTVLLVIVSLL